MQRNSKYNAKKTIFKGIKFDSQKRSTKIWRVITNGERKVNNKYKTST